MKHFVLCPFLILLTHCYCNGQTVLFNTTQNVYELIDGTCNYDQIPITYAGCPNCSAFSIARFKDTLYMLTAGGVFYWMDLKSPGTAYPLPFRNLNMIGNNLTCDRNGFLYDVGNQNELYRMDPHTGQTVSLGTIPYALSGDLTFFRDTLLMATGNGIYAMNVNNPNSIHLFMDNNGYTFYGLVSLPSTCDQNKLYGLGFSSTGDFKLIGIDPDTRTFNGETCDLPSDILDAASLVEDGTTFGVSIDSVFLQSPCGTDLTGNAHIYAFSASKNPLSYTLDGATTNTTGIFDQLSLGTHTVHITTREGCSKDSTFILTRGLSAVVNVTSSGPSTCLLTNGSIEIQASTETAPLLFSLNDGALQTNPNFDTLPAGSYNIKIIDGGHCEKDLPPLTLNYKSAPVFIDHVTVTPATCTSNNGTIVITPVAGLDPRTLHTFLNGVPQSQFTIQGLSANSYVLSILSAADCKFDTTIQIKSVSNAEPAIKAIVRDPVCAADDGTIQLSVNGASGPYKMSFNNGGYSGETNYAKLTGGNYSLNTMDKDGCNWDTLLTVRSYTKDMLNIAFDSTNPNCRELNSGSITVHIEGSKPPYLLQYNGLSYANGATISGLNSSKLSFLVTNRDGCTVDSISPALHWRCGLAATPSIYRMLLAPMATAIMISFAYGIVPT